MLPLIHVFRIHRVMRSSRSDQTKLFRLAALCQEAIQSQHQRASSQGYGLDDYTEGRIVGAANLARKLMRVIASDQPEAAHAGVQLRKQVGR
jgi:hypothetical protein